MTHSFSPAQLRAARALLDLSRTDLAERTGVSEPTIHRFEHQQGEPEARTQSKIRCVLEDMGIEFLPNEGVSRRRNEVTIYRGKTTDPLYQFLDDVYDTLKEKGGEMCICGIDERLFDKYSREGNPHATRMLALKVKVSYRMIMKEGDYYFPYKDISEFRWMPADQFESVPFYLYGKKLAILNDTDQGLEIFILNSPTISMAFKKQFEFMWERCVEVPAKVAKEA